MRRVLRSAAVSLATISALVVGGCSSDSQVDSIYSTGGWPGMHADARNSDTSPVTGSNSLTFAWSRPLGAPSATAASVSAGGQIFVTTRSESGCNLYSFEIESGRKRWCTRLGPGVAAATPLVDHDTNVYIGEDGAMNSFNEHGQLRWRTVVSGTPMSAQFTADGNVLFVTQFGIVSVLSPQTGKEIVPSYQLIPAPTVDQAQDVPLPPAAQGLDQCFLGSPECPVAHPPAVDLGSGRFYVNVWRPGRPQSEIVAMRYADGALSEEWTSDAVIGGSSSSPVLSADGGTLYANDAKGTLWALDTGTGKSRWSHDVGYVAADGPSVTADGLLVPAGGRDGHLLALRDKGDHAELAWERKDVLQLGVPAQTAGGTGFTVVRDGTAGLAVLAFDTGSGETASQTVLPGAAGFTVGTSIGPGGEVLTPTLLGELFVLAP
ncbi:PQQ-binding-like beta-propeller repeat protein [Rhodococcus sp. NPDC059234]|uniref:outer membrane protein assembly factor BamB family protein n=1 Tax=Rhodococcus sp. NPDC059234 TaxID=3346781 RepID=UPI003670F6D2